MRKIRVGALGLGVRATGRGDADVTLRRDRRRNIVLHRAHWRLRSDQTGRTSCGGNLMKRVSLLLGIAAAVAFGGIAAAQGDYPNQMVRIIVPFSAGSITDGL